MDVGSELKRRAQRRRLLAARRYRSRWFWRTISRRRKLVGIFVLAVLLGGAGFVYWFTSPKRIEAMAEQYLAELTGRPVKIQDARFSPFEGVRIRRLRIWPAGSEATNPDDVEFAAEEVLLKLETGSLLAGRLKVTSIVVVRPEMRRHYSFTKPAASTPSGDRPATPKFDFKLPVIELREGRLLLLSKAPDIEFVTPLSAELNPDPDVPDRYRIAVRFGQPGQEQSASAGTVTLQPAFEVQLDTLVVHSLNQLPKYLADLLARYDIDPVNVSIRGGFTPGADELMALFVECKGTKMSLPVDELLPRQPADARAAVVPDAPLPPLRLTDVHGQITVRLHNRPLSPGELLPAGQVIFGQPDENGKLAPMKAKLNGLDLALAGRYEGFAADAAFDVELALTAAPIPLPDDLPPNRLPRGLHRLYELYSVNGRADLEMRLIRPTRGGDVAFSGKVRPIDCTARYNLYPYEFGQVTGLVTFDERQINLDLAGRRGQAGVAVKGWVENNWPSAMDLTVTGTDVPVDENLHAALARKQGSRIRPLEDLRVFIPPGQTPDQPSQAQIWAGRQSPRWQANGAVDFTARVQRDRNPESSHLVNVEISGIRGVDIAFFPFNYLGRILSGTATISDQGVRLRNVAVAPRHTLRSASQPDYDPTTIVLVDGLIGLGDKSGLPTIDLEISASSLPLDGTLWRAFPPQATAELLKYQIDARAAIFGTITSRPGQPVSFDITAQLKGGGMIAEQFPYALETLAGRVRVTDQAIELDNVIASHNAVPIIARGRIGIAATQPTELTIRADRLPLCENLKAALTADMRKIWDSLSPGGMVGVDARLTQPAGGPNGARPPLTTTVALTALGNTLCYDAFPYPLSNVVGQAIIHLDRVEIVQMSDEQAGRRVEMSGTIWHGRDNLNLAAGEQPLPKAELKVSMTNASFDESLRQAVPWQVRKMWNDVLPAGQFDLRLDYLRMTPLGEPTRWDFGGQLDLRNGRGTFGVDLDRLTGQLAGHGALITGHSAAFVGQLNLAEAGIAGRPVSSLSANVIQDGRTNKLRFEELSARLHGGYVSGFAEVGITEPDLPYRLSLAGREIDINELINFGVAEEARWKLTGRLDGRIAVDGKAATGIRRGRGDLVITRAEIYNIPPVLPVMQLRPPASQPNQAAEIIFYLDGNRLSLAQANLRDPAVSLLGAGGLDLDSRHIDLTFVVGQPKSPAQGGVRVVEELISGARDELMRYRVTGPLDSPRVESASLSSIREALEELNRARSRGRRLSPPPKDPRLNTSPLPGIEPTEPGGN